MDLSACINDPEKSGGFSKIRVPPPPPPIFKTIDFNVNVLFLSRAQTRNWLIFRYPLASMMVAYVLVLVLVGLSRTRLFQKFYSKYFKGS